MLAAAAAVETINAAPYVGVIGGIIMWCGLATVIILIGKYIIRGVAMAVTEALLGGGFNAEKIARWFTSNDQVLACMKHLIERLGDDPDEVIRNAKK